MFLECSEPATQSDFGNVYSVKGKKMRKLDCPSFHMVCRPDMSNSIAVSLVLLFLKVLPLPLIIAYVVLEQLVLQLILVSSNNY